jgi:adhesin HecA-like repeat protein
MEKKMIEFKHSSAINSSTTTCGWFMAILMSALLIGCGGGGDGGTSASASATVIPGAVGTPGASATNPTVGSSNPSNNATNVPTSTNGTGNVVTGTLVTATFTQPMNPATINSAPAGTLLTFTLKTTVSGTNVPGTVAMNAANTIATFTPTAAALTPNTSYTATVTTAAKNAGGTAMAHPVAWSFTTKSVASTAQAPINLLSILTNNFVILTQTGITNTGSHTSAITGNIGASPITASAMDNVFCSEITGTIYGVDAAYVGSGAVTCFAGNPPAANKTLVDNAALDMGTAYNEAAGRTLPDFTELGAGNISGMTLTPGLYKWSSGLSVNADVTLAGGANDVWIFQIAQDLTVANGIKINLAPGVQAKNIFWQVGGGTGVAIGTTAHIEGTILAQKAITLATGSVVNGGRLLAQTAVTLDATTVTNPAQ